MKLHIGKGWRNWSVPEDRIQIITDSRQKYQINTSAREDQTLVKKLSDYLIELTILLDPLEAQINIIKGWQRWIKSHRNQQPWGSESFEEDIKAREDQLGSLKRLQKLAKESQALVSAHLG